MQNQAHSQNSEELAILKKLSKVCAKQFCAIAISPVKAVFHQKSTKTRQVASQIILKTRS